MIDSDLVAKVDDMLERLEWIRRGYFPMTFVPERIEDDDVD